ncbi:MAG TPA: multiheme c-type cytochrome [Candidatus Eisenbacteria bacterium]
MTPRRDASPARRPALAGLVLAAAFVAAATLALALGGRPALAGPSAAPERHAIAAKDSSSCITCHSQQDERSLSKPATEWPNDVHAAAGLGCESCHGGDPTRKHFDDEDDAADYAMNPAKGFTQAPSRTEVPQFCARCHSDANFMKRYNPQARVDQYAEYRTSVHGQRNAKGETKPAECVDCHGVHGIRAVSSPDSPVYATNVPKTCAHCHADSTKMAEYKIPTDQYAKYQRSVHARALIDQGDLSAPACNDCHGNHGATPPEVKSVANVCGQCHGRESILYDASSHKKIFADRKAPECIVCHGNHLVRHPTPELFNGGSAPQVSLGQVIATDPFAARLDTLPPNENMTAVWRDVLALHLPPDDFRYAHHVEIGVEGAAPITLDATVRPGSDAPLPPARAQGPSGLTASLEMQGLSSYPIESGDAVLYRLNIQTGANWEARGITIRDVPGEGVMPHPGPACRQCHTAGDSCDAATGKMYAALTDLDQRIRGANRILRRAELAGMLVSGPQFELKSKGVTAEVEARSLLHSFDPGRLVKRAHDGIEAANAGTKAGEGALTELQVRRKGLAVSLVLIALVLVGLGFKIRESDRTRQGGSVRPGGP